MVLTDEELLSVVKYGLWTKVKDYDDYLSLKDFGPRGALKGPRGLIKRHGEPPYYLVINVEGASYDLIVEDDNYGW